MKSKLRILAQVFEERGIAGAVKSLVNYSRLMFRRVLRPGSPLVLLNVHGWKMYVDARDPGVARALAVHGVREKLETRVMREHLGPGMRVLDIGANIGYYALLEASMVGNIGKVYAIEPHPWNTEILRRNVQLNDFGDIIEVYEIAVAGVSGEAAMYLGQANNLHTLIKPSPDLQSGPTNQPRSIRVETTTVDEFLKEKGDVDLVRMDIEGFECQAVDGMQALLRQPKPPLLFIEVHPYSYTTTTPELDFGVRLRRLLQLGMVPKVVISASAARPAKFVEFGYWPRETVREGPLERGLYTDVRSEHLLELVLHRPKVTRAVLLGV